VSGGERRVVVHAAITLWDVSAARNGSRMAVRCTGAATPIDAAAGVLIAMLCCRSANSRATIQTVAAACTAITGQKSSRQPAATNSP
jgi:hypothetical protein